MTLPVQLDGQLTREIAALMHDVVIPRADTAQNLAGYIVAAAASTEPTFNLAQLAHYAPRFVTNPGRTFRNLFTNPRWEPEQLVAALYGAAPLADVEVVVLEYELVGSGESRWGVVSLHALGQGSTVPLDWRRFRADQDDHDTELQRCVHELVDDMLNRYGTVAEGRLPVVVALHPEIGEWRDLRHWVATRVGECAMVVTQNYTADRMVIDIYAERHPGGRLADFFEGWPLDQPPRPVPLKRGTSGVYEYVVQFPAGQARGVAIIAPARRFTRGLQGQRIEHRAAEIGALLAAVEHGSVTRALRVHAFRHASDATFRRHALLMSALGAFLAGHLPNPKVPRAVSAPVPS